MGFRPQRLLPDHGSVRLVAMAQWCQQTRVADQCVVAAKTCGGDCGGDSRQPDQRLVAQQLYLCSLPLLGFLHHLGRCEKNHQNKQEKRATTKKRTEHGRIAKNKKQVKKQIEKQTKKKRKGRKETT